jgi:hypothetical protein
MGTFPTRWKGNPLPLRCSYATLRGPMNITERLSALSAEIAEARTAVRILEEQLAFQADVAEDARVRALVSETPIADRDYRIARDDLERLRRSRDDEMHQLQELEAERDALLDRLAG